VGGPSDLELLKRAFTAWGRGDFTNADFFAPDIEFVTAGIDERTYLGHEGVREGWYDFLSAWRDFRVEAEEIVDIGDGRYLVFVRLVGRGKESSVPIEAEVANIITMRDGRIARQEQYWDRDEARRAAGLA
jgi:ketosteroid isomerase-like protein